MDFIVAETVKEIKKDFPENGVVSICGYWMSNLEMNIFNEFVGEHGLFVSECSEFANTDTDRVHTIVVNIERLLPKNEILLLTQSNIDAVMEVSRILYNEIPCGSRVWFDGDKLRIKIAQDEIARGIIIHEAEGLPSQVITGMKELISCQSKVNSAEMSDFMRTILRWVNSGETNQSNPVLKDEDVMMQYRKTPRPGMKALEFRNHCF